MADKTTSTVVDPVAASAPRIYRFAAGGFPALASTYVPREDDPSTNQVFLPAAGVYAVRWRVVADQTPGSWWQEGFALVSWDGVAAGVSVNYAEPGLQRPVAANPLSSILAPLGSPGAFALQLANAGAATLNVRAYMDIEKASP